MLSVLTGLAGDHADRSSPFACVNHFTSRCEERRGFASPGMNWPRNQPRVSFDAAAALPDTGAGASGAARGIAIIETLQGERPGEGAFGHASTLQLLARLFALEEAPQLLAARRMPQLAQRL